jgi:hypothetical protein
VAGQPEKTAPSVVSTRSSDDADEALEESDPKVRDAFDREIRTAIRAGDSASIRRHFAPSLATEIIESIRGRRTGTFDVKRRRLRAQTDRGRATFAFNIYLISSGEELFAYSPFLARTEMHDGHLTFLDIHRP